jgi:hypothetical protein
MLVGRQDFRPQVIKLVHCIVHCIVLYCIVLYCIHTVIMLLIVYLASLHTITIKYNLPPFQSLPFDVHRHTIYVSVQHIVIWYFCYW